MKCINCGNGVAFGCKHCVKCLEKAKLRSAERYKKIKMERKCKLCSGKVSKGIYCDACRKKRKSRYANKKEDGMCVVCGKRPADKTAKCDLCHEAYVENARIRRERRLLEGRCVYCEEMRVSTTLCLKHYLQFTAKTHFRTSKRYKELEDLFNSQQGICPYTGRKLTLGVDASIDHIVPKSRGGSDDLNNLQWVYYQVNFMKGDMLEEEFLELARSIAERAM